MFIHLWMTRALPGWLMSQGWGRSCCCPFPRPSSPRLLWCLPAPAPASDQCSLHQLPAGRPNFNPLLSLSILFMVFRIADCSRPVTMADYCWCPGACWPHTIVHQSTGLFKPLIECMVLGRLLYSFFSSLEAYSTALVLGREVGSAYWFISWKGSPS